MSIPIPTKQLVMSLIWSSTEIEVRSASRSQAYLFKPPDFAGQLRAPLQNPIHISRNHFLLIYVTFQKSISTSPQHEHQLNLHHYFIPKRATYTHVYIYIDYICMYVYIKRKPWQKQQKKVPVRSKVHSQHHQINTK